MSGGPIVGTMNSGLSWDEFRLVKSIAEARSLVGAAERLGVNHSTVFRRLAAVESAVGARLFERSRAGYEPTVGRRRNDRAGVHDGRVGARIRASGRRPRHQADGRIVRHHARSDRPAFHAGDRRPVSSAKSGRRGRTDPVGSVAQPLPARRRHRNSHDQRPAGSAGRKENLHRTVGRLLPPRPGCGDSAPRRSGSIAFIGFGDNFGPASARRWIEANVPPERLVAKANSAHCMLQLARQGVGAALLPCFLGDGMSRSSGSAIFCRGLTQACGC